MFKKLFIFLVLFSTTLFAQQKVVTSIDTTKNKIGAEFKLSIKTTVDTASRVVFPNLKNIGALEVIRSYPIDTVLKNDQYELIKKYGLTQFDSGAYAVPSFKIFINNKPFLTDSLRVEVANVQVDTLKQKMFEIKTIIKTQDSIGDWWKYLLGLLLLGTAGYFGFQYYQKRKQNKTEEIIFKTPIEKATSLLNTLEKKELWQNGDVKSYYSELTDIARNYIEEAIEIPAMESTTAELILALKSASQKKKMKLTAETIENLERVLKQADLVKFAKSKPLEFEITEDSSKIQRVILTLDEAIPVEVAIDEDTLLNEAQKQKQLKLAAQKLRKKKINIAIGATVGFLVITFMLLVATKGFDYVIDTAFGHPTKSLLEGEWVKSEYGNPGVIIETPEVLKRVDLTKTLPKNGMALIKEMQSFAIGSISTDFYLMVSTLKYKQETPIDLAKSLDSTLQSLEVQGAQNMIVKQEDFETPEGLKGIKGYGTFSKIDGDKKSSEKLYYEVLLFSQDGGLQQIILVHQEGDQYANQISERVLNSVELIQAGK